MTCFPLVFHTSLDRIIAWRDGAAVSAREFLADAARLAAGLPAGEHVLNLCADRYRFAVGLCAALLARKTTVLPASQTPHALRQLTAFAPDIFCLHDSADWADSADCDVGLPAYAYPDSLSERLTDAPESTIPRIEATRTVAYLFTSGSTGKPVAHAKQWGSLVRCLRASAARLDVLDKPCVLVGTVPAQHMFGFEMTVLLALIGGCAFSNSRPFYPLDVAAQLAAVPEPRVLVTSPLHLRVLARAELSWPPVALVLSATAPLAPELAKRAREQFNSPLVEIYGSTETGQIATRALDTAWTLLPGITLEAKMHQEEAARNNTDGEAPLIWASGGHLKTPVPLGDVLELLDEHHFLLHGRRADLINIGGKRTSLAYLTHQLLALPGVEDGVFFMPDEADTDTRVTRLTALAVAPGLTSALLQQALRARIDAAFMPRPLLLVDALPRNAMGKLPREALKALAQRSQRANHRATLCFAADHPALAGHFPGRPIVPGALLLDHVITAIGAALQRPLEMRRLRSAKFPSPAQPGERLDVEFEITASRAIRFTVAAGARVVASGVLDALEGESQ